jgi:hypothetical protein
MDLQRNTGRFGSNDAGDRCAMSVVIAVIVAEGNLSTRIAGTLTTGLTGIPLSSGQAESGGVGFVGEDYHLHTPNTQGYNVTVQYQLASNDTIEVGYVGNTVHHLGSYVNPNTPQEILPHGLNSYAYSTRTRCFT